MRPNFHEQISETCRLLEQIVLPAVTQDHPGEVLRGLIGNLRMLSAAWPLLIPFLEWDNAATAGLLAQFEPEHAGWTARVAQAQPTAGDVDSLTECNQRLRGLLCECLVGLPESDVRMSAIRDHLAARSSRYPMRSTLLTPKSLAHEVA